MARIYNDRNDNPLANLAQSYLDERFRRRQQQLTGDELRFGQDIKAQDTYQKPVRDKLGNYQGLETDSDLYGRDTEIARNKAPGFFERILQKAEPAQSSVSSLESGKPLDQEEPLDQMTRRITMENRAKAAELGLPSYNPNASRAAPAMPAKLLGPGKFEVDPRQVKPGDVLQKNTIQGDQDVTRYARPIEPIRGEGMVIAASPEKPEVKQSLSPSPMMLRDIRGMITSGTMKDADPLISAMSLPPSLRKELGLEGFKGDIPRSILSEMIKRRPGGAGKDSDGISPATYQIIQQVESGQMPYNQAMRSLYALKGSAPTPREQEAIKTALTLYGAGIKTKQAQEEKQIARQDKLERQRDASLEKFEKAYTKTGIAGALPFIRQLEGETGIVSGEDASLKKLPGTATNFARNIPFIGNFVAGNMAKFYDGSATAQAIQGLLNAQIRTQSGQAVTSYEEGRTLTQAGLSTGNEKDVARGIKLMLEGLQEADRSVRSAFPEAAADFTSGGGQGSIQEEVAPITQGRKIRKQAKAGAKSDTESNAQYISEVRQARAKLDEYRQRRWKDLAAGKTTASEISNEIENLRKQTDEYMRGKYGKGFSEESR